MRRYMLPLLVFGLIGRAIAQVSTPTTHAGPTFDVVSIRRTTAITPFNAPSRPIVLPDGGMRLTNTRIMNLIASAYPPAIPKDMSGLPEWARTEGYDISATSSLSHATADDRAAMLRAMLEDRFKLRAHFDRRELSSFDLVLARRDGQLGPGLTRVETDCARILAERKAAEEAGEVTTPAPGQRTDYSMPPPPCAFRTISSSLRDMAGDKKGAEGDLLEGSGTMDSLAGMLRLPTRNLVINKTDLPGSYAVKMNFDMKSTMIGPSAVSTSNAASAFTALQEQLGLKLQRSRTEQVTLIIDQLERPTEN